MRSAVALTVALALASLEAFAQVGSPPPFSESDMKRVRSPFGDRPIKQVKSEAEIRAKTPEDVARAAYFDLPPELTFGKKLMEVGNLIMAGPETPPSMPPPPPELMLDQPPDPFRENICEADAVIVGEATRDRVLLNRSETFLITVHDVSVYEWIRSGGNTREARVSVAGGIVHVGEKAISSRSGAFPDLFRPAILELRTIPGAAGYAFEGEPVSVPPSMADRQDLLMKYRDAAASCQKRGR
jgi:hypothetical protein